MSTRLDEVASIRAAQQGDIGAFESLYRLHVGRVYALALRLTGDPGRAGEATQDVFVRVWERVGTFRGESAFGTWLHRLAVNVVLQAERADARRLKRVDVRDPVTLALHPGPSSASEFHLDLDTAIARLPRRARLVFVLHDIEGYDHGEIAQLTGLALSSVRSQLSRARQTLRLFLG